MRWIWIDKFVEFEPGRRAVAVKNLTLAEEHLHDHFPGYPIMPASLIIEGMAQTAGILVGEARGFREKVILAKVGKAEFHHVAVPGDRLEYHAEAQRIDDVGASTTGQVIRDNGKTREVLADIEIMFSHIDQNLQGLKFPQENFVFTDEFMRLFRSYRVDHG